MSTLLPPPRRLTRGWAIALGIPFAAGLALLTLSPTPVEDNAPTLIQTVLDAAHNIGWTSLNFTSLELIANILVFLPVGIFAFIVLPRRVWPLALLVGPALSFLIEALQRLALPHRTSSATDVLANSAGATVGVAVAVLCTLLFARRAASAS